MNKLRALFATPSRRGLLAVVCAALAYASVIQTFNWNQTSHYDLIRAIALNGTPKIDPFISNTGDRARYRGHWYSSRAPGLAFFTLPAYEVLRLGHASEVFRDAPAQRNDDEILWALALWGSVLPALIIMLVARKLAERVEPGYGTLAAVTLGLGSLLLPIGTLLFSHVLSACLALAAFAVLLRERDGPPRLLSVALAGLLIGYGITTEYPVLFAGLILGVYLLTRPGLSWLDRAKRAGAYAGGVVIGVLPLALYDLWAFGTVTHVAYADIPQHHAGFFGISPPDIPVAITLLFSSRGLLTLAPVLVMALAGIVLLHRRGRRAEAWVITVVSLVYLAYNSGYFLPFGGGTPGPRFMLGLVPFLGVPLALAYRRWPGPTLALGVASIATMGLVTLTHPLVGRGPEVGIFTRAASNGQFQPSIVNLFFSGSGWKAPIPFLIAAVAAVLLAVSATPRPSLDRRQLGAGVVAVAVWVLCASFGPPELGIDRVDSRKIHAAGDRLGFLEQFGHHPLLKLCLAVGTLSVACLFASRWAPWSGPAAKVEPAEAPREAALTP
jgi:hypothetical protein